MPPNKAVPPNRTRWRASVTVRDHGWAAVGHRRALGRRAGLVHTPKSEAMKRSLRQVNVFSSDPLLGNPLAVVHAADGLSEEQMSAFARWTHLSETTYLLTPTDAAADYRVR